MAASNYLYNAFKKSYFGVVTNSTPSEAVNFSKNNVFSKFIRLDFTKDFIEMPSFLNTFISGSIRDYKIFSEKLKVTPYCSSKGIITDFVYFLFVGDSVPAIKRGIDSTFRALLVENGLKRLNWVRNEGRDYYGNPSMILDADFTPLVMSTVQVTYDRDNIVKEELILNVHPKVFTGEKTLVDKGIINSVIPHFLSQTPSVQIRDLEYMIESPEKPDLITFSNEDINDFLIANSENIRVFAV